jgi:ribosomal subunit interface protein
MQHTITARHCEIPDDLRTRAREILDRTGEIAGRPVEGTALFDVSGVGRTVELRLHVSKGDLLVAKAEADDHRSALDKAEDKLRRQATKVGAPPRRSREIPVEAPSEI